MIRYSLICSQEHEFESWFSSADSYEEQVHLGYVSCPVCGCQKTEKQIMAPSVLNKAEGYKEPDLSLMNNDRKSYAFLRELKERILSQSENVGIDFPEQARKMHYGEVEHRAIHGETSLDETRSLIEEGINIIPLPTLPEDRH